MTNRRSVVCYPAMSGEPAVARPALWRESMRPWLPLVALLEKDPWVPSEVFDGETHRLGRRPGLRVSLPRTTALKAQHSPNKSLQNLPGKTVLALDRGYLNFSTVTPLHSGKNLNSTGALIFNLILSRLFCFCSPTVLELAM